MPLHVFNNLWVANKIWNKKYFLSNKHINNTSTCNKTVDSLIKFIITINFSVKCTVHTVVQVLCVYLQGLNCNVNDVGDLLVFINQICS